MRAIVKFPDIHSLKLVASVVEGSDQILHFLDHHRDRDYKLTLHSDGAWTLETGSTRDRIDHEFVKRRRRLMEPTEKMREMIEEFQCPGCSRGCDTKDTCFKLEEQFLELGQFSCLRHCPGTILFPGGTTYLGMPKGFNRVGSRLPDCDKNHNIRLWSDGKSPAWNHLNIAVWFSRESGYLFVRTYLPRVNVGFIDVIDDSVGYCPPPLSAFSVKDFIDEID